MIRTLVGIGTVGIAGCGSGTADDTSGEEADATGQDAATATVAGSDAPTLPISSTLTADDSSARDAFGKAVATAGDLALVGAPGEDNEAGPTAGAAYLYEQSGDNWLFQTRLAAADGDAEDYFGSSVALSAETAVVGAKWDDDPHGNGGGSAYVFERAGGDWTQTAKLTAAVGEPEDHFGQSVALDGDRVLIGAEAATGTGGARTGAAYVFVRGDTWTQTATLRPADDAEEGFGLSVALDGTTAVVGAPQDDSDNGNTTGSAYVFGLSEGTWNHQATLYADDRDREDAFGRSVSGDTAVVGAELDDDPNGDGGGSAYVFERSGGAWGQAAKLAAPDGEAGDHFGDAVALADGRVIVGANAHTNLSGDQTGAAYVFERSGGDWALAGKTIDEDGETGANAGDAVALQAGAALVGAPGGLNPDGVSAGVVHAVEF